MKREWTRIEAGPDAVDVRPANIYRGVTIRVVSPDGEVTLKPEEARALLLKIAAALDANAAPELAPAESP